MPLSNGKPVGPQSDLQALASAISVQTAAINKLVEINQRVLVVLLESIEDDDIDGAVSGSEFLDDDD